MQIAARILACLAPALLAGCANPTVIADVATTPGESRTFTQVNDDSSIKLGINEALLSSRYRDLYFEVASAVYQGRVLLTGKVRTEADKQRATNMVRDIPRVKEIFNEIQVNVPGGLSSNDAYIETEIKVRAADVPELKAIDYRWTAVNGVVYLIGYAKSDAEAQRMIDVIRNTKYVTQVVPHVWTQP
jgi:osmotically-inducible protein OsmY